MCAEFLAFAANEEGSFEDTYHILIMDHRVVNRTMLSQKINNIHHAVCACVENAEQVREMMASARQYNTFSNFDYIFIETGTDNVGLEVIKDIRRQGFQGKIIAVNYSQQDTSVLVCPEAADAQVMCADLLFLSFCQFVSVLLDCYILLSRMRTQKTTCVSFNTLGVPKYLCLFL